MTEKENSYQNLRQNRSIKLFILISVNVLIAFSLSLSLRCFAKSGITYGPIVKGQNLWDIAKETRPDDSVSIEQLVYALYKSNPDAFQAANMNLLKKGAFLNIPDTETLLKTSKAEAKKELSKHLHALEVLRVDARQLKKVKTSYRKYKRQIVKLQKQLGKYRHRSKAWNKTYRKLVKSKRGLIKSKRKIAKLSRLLLEKATLKYTQPAIKNSAAPNVLALEVNKRLGLIQNSLQQLEQSNNKLLEKVEQLAALNQRVKILEDELGKNDEIVIQLQQSLKQTQEEIQQQKQEKNSINQRLEKLEATRQDPNNAPESSIEGTNTNTNTHYPSTTPPQDNSQVKAIKTIYKPHNKVIKNSKGALSTDQDIKNSPIIKNFSDKISNHPPLNNGRTPAPTPKGNWIDYLRNRFILIGGILNGIILIFVLYKLFVRKQTDVETEGKKTETYKPWQEREKPRRI